MVGRLVLLLKNRKLLLLTLLGFSLLIASCRGYFSSTIYPAYLQRADKVIHLADIPELSSALKGKSFQARVRSFSFDSERFIGIQVLFKENSMDDLLIVLTGDLRYKKTYDRSDFELPPGYKFGTLFSEGYGKRILIGFEYGGGDPTLRSQLVAFDPTGKEIFIKQIDPDGVCVSFQGGIPTEDAGGGTWIAQVFNQNTLNFTLLPANYSPPTPAPPASGTNVSVFAYNYPQFVLSQYVKDPERNLAALLFRSVSDSSGTGWVVYRLPIGSPTNTTTPLITTPPSFGLYGTFQMDQVYRDDLFFYTVDGIVRLSDQGPWSLFPFYVDPTFSSLTVSSSDLEGPEIRIEDSQVYHFSVDGKWFYVFDTDKLRVTRARTWW